LAFTRRQAERMSSLRGDEEAFAELKEEVEREEEERVAEKRVEKGRERREREIRMRRQQGQRRRLMQSVNIAKKEESRWIEEFKGRMEEEEGGTEGEVYVKWMMERRQLPVCEAKGLKALVNDILQF
jgi:PAS domain-containing protein